MQRIGVIKEYIEYFDIPKNVTDKEIKLILQTTEGKIKILNRMQIFEYADIDYSAKNNYFEEDYTDEILALDNGLNENE